MNDTNNNLSENTIDEKVKIEYVNPLNPNEVLSSKNTLSVEAMQPLEEIKSEIEIEEKVVTTDEENPIPMSKPKRKNKLVIVIVVLIALAIILAGILLIPKLLDNKDKPIIDTPNQQETKISLSNIVTNATNNTYYKFLTSTYTVNINEVNDSIVFNLNSIDQTNPINKQITFNLIDRNLVITLNTLEDNTDNLNAIYAIADSIGQYYGHGIDETGNHLYSNQNNYNFNTTGITSSELTTEVVDPVTGEVTTIPTNEIQISINIDSNIDTTGLNSMYFSLDDLNTHKDNITNNSILLRKGDLVLYTNNSDIYTIVIAQRKELNDNTYNTITSIIELLYPEEIDDFKSKFTSLSTISFDKYKITIDSPTASELLPEYSSNYKFILIEITKQA